MVQLLNLYVTTRKTIVFTIRTFVGKMMSLLFNILSKFVIAFLSRSKSVLISWLQSPSAVIFFFFLIGATVAQTVGVIVPQVLIRDYLPC